jgi:hypothetical protein
MTPQELAKSGTEHAHQRALFAWANMAAQYGVAAANDLKSYKSKKYTEDTYGVNQALTCLTDMFAIPNGGKRDPITASRLKAEGVKAGVSDIFLPQPNDNYCGLFIELKALGKKPTTEQKDFISRMNKKNYYAICVEGWEAARDIIINYLIYHL